MDGPLVRERHDAEDPAAQLRNLRPESYPFSIGLQFHARGIADDADAHPSRDVGALVEHPDNPCVRA